VDHAPPEGFSFYVQLLADMFQGRSDRSDQEGFVLRSVSARGCQGIGVPELVLTQEQLGIQGHGLLVS